MNKPLLIALFLAVAPTSQAFAQQYRFPSQPEQQNFCHKTHGTWRSLPDSCDNMHPRSWRKLTPDQQKECMDIFNRPCDCGPGLRFSVVNVLGCIPDKFAKPQN